MSMEKPHKKLEVWKCAMKVAQLVYEMTGQFPAEEKFGLVSQMRRAAVSIPCNIAEGAARKGKKEFKNFLSMAQASLSELDTQMDLSICLGFTTSNDVATISRELVKIDKMLTGLIRSLGKASSRDTGAS
jgi:four helix bundle protein